MITLLNKFDDNYIIEKDDVVDITERYIKDNNLTSYVNEVIFNDKEKSNYDSDKQILKYNLKDIMNSNIVLFNQLKSVVNIDEKYTSYYLNYFYLYFIYKELNHISQKAKYSEKEDIKGYLYDLSNRVNIDDRSEHLLPMNREAEKTSLLTAVNFLDYTKLPNKEANKMHLYYLKKLLLNYNRKNNYQVSSPIELLSDLYPIIDIDKINELLDNSKLSKIERLNLGLPVTTKEYDSVKNEIVKRLKK